MSQLLRVLPLALLGLTLLSSCGGSKKDRLPPAGTITAADPKATALYSSAQHYETGGQTKKAIKAYAKVADEFPYAAIAPEARFRQAALLDSQGESLKAFKSYQAFITRYKGSALYSKALERQATVAHAAADGHIKSSFLGIKTRVGLTETVKMLEEVRDNAPQAESAPKAQFTIGQLYGENKKSDEAIAAYRLVVSDHPSSGYAPESQFQIGTILLTQASRGNHNQANLDRSRHAFEDLLQTYPNAKRAPEARAQLQNIGGRDIQRSFNIAEFYYKKKEFTSAAFYYQEVLRTTNSGSLHEQATTRLATISSN